MIRQIESKSFADLSYSQLKQCYATHPPCSRSDNVHDHKLWQYPLCRVVCHDLDNCVSTLSSHQSLWLQSWKLLSVTWTLCSGSGSRQHILERRPRAMSGTLHWVPPQCAQPCANQTAWLKPLWLVWVASLLWLLPDPCLSNSLTLFLSKSSFFPRESSSWFRWWMFIPRNSSSLPGYDLTEGANFTNTTLALEQNDTALFAVLRPCHMRDLHYVTWTRAYANTKGQQTAGSGVCALVQVRCSVQANTSIKLKYYPLQNPFLFCVSPVFLTNRQPGTRKTHLGSCLFFLTQSANSMLTYSHEVLPEHCCSSCADVAWLLRLQWHRRKCMWTYFTCMWALINTNSTHSSFQDALSTSY